MRFDMTFDVTLRDDSRFGKLTIRVIKIVSFSLLLKVRANFAKEYLWKSIYFRFPGSLKPSSSYVLFSSKEKISWGSVVVSQNPFKT